MSFRAGASAPALFRKERENMRLDRFLADAGLGSRSQVKEMIRRGRILVNGKPVKQADLKIDAERDMVECDHKQIAFRRHHYYMLNKPAGVVSATEDRSEQTVLSLLNGVPYRGLFPAGRLDKDTEGLLLITDDGGLAHRLLAPDRHVDKTYFVRAAGIVTQEDLQSLRDGMDIGEKKRTLPAEAVLQAVSEEDNTSEVLLTIREGKYHQVKRMFEKIGRPVRYLKRLSFGALVLDPNLAPGEYRELTEEEIRVLCGEEEAGGKPEL